MKRIKRIVSAVAVLTVLALCLAGCGGKPVETAGDGIIDGNELLDVALTEVKAWTVGEKATIGGYGWTVIAIEEDSTLLLCDSSVKTDVFNDAYEDAVWAACSLRTWLNGEFLETLRADTDFNSALLITETVTTAENIVSGTGECTSTDTVFLLSMDEVKAYGAAISKISDDCWLRTTGEEKTHATVLRADGSIHVTGYRSDLPVAGVRPCIRVEANNEIASNVTTLANAQAGGQIAFGSYGGEAVVWDVLAVSGGKALIMTDKVIDAVPFNAENGVSYAESELATWLNGSFKNAAFTADEQAKIDTETAVVTVENPNYATEGGADSAGIFVLSVQEFRTYCTTDGTRLAEAIDYAVTNGADVDPYHGTAGYWLRTLGKNTDRTCYVKYYGEVEYDGAQQLTTYLGVRPAMWVTIG